MEMTHGHDQEARKPFFSALGVFSPVMEREVSFSVPVHDCGVYRTSSDFNVNI